MEKPSIVGRQQRCRKNGRAVPPTIARDRLFVPHTALKTPDMSFHAASRKELLRCCLQSKSVAHLHPVIECTNHRDVVLGVGGSLVGTNYGLERRVIRPL